MATKRKPRIEKSINQLLRIAMSSDDPVEVEAAKRIRAAVDGLCDGRKCKEVAA
jgi:hypothetical protein